MSVSLHDAQSPKQLCFYLSLSQITNLLIEFQKCKTKPKRTLLTAIDLMVTYESTGKFKRTIYIILFCHPQTDDVASQIFIALDNLAGGQKHIYMGGHEKLCDCEGAVMRVGKRSDVDGQEL